MIYNTCFSHAGFFCVIDNESNFWLWQVPKANQPNIPNVGDVPLLFMNVLI